MAADEQVLGSLHTKVAEVLNDLLDGQEIPTGEIDDETGEERKAKMPPSAAVITSAIQFLKNNNITCTPSKDNALGELERKVEERKARRAGRATAHDLTMAADDMGFLGGLPN